MVTVWERDDPGPRIRLDRESVVGAAIRIADQDGLGAVSVRRVAADLGAGPMRLYRIFDTVDELTDMMADAAYAQMVQRARRTGDWRARVRSVAEATRAVVLDHEWVADLLGAHPAIGPHGLAWLELLADGLGRCPELDGRSQVRTAIHVIDGFLIGSLRREVSDRRCVRAGADAWGWSATAGGYLERAIEAGPYPVLRDLSRPVDRRTPERLFGDELAVVLRGLGRAR
ncbi:TetR/AcrR family transcriptional regulator C-terminal domain-containing protein [Gordonia sinesedis]